MNLGGEGSRKPGGGIVSAMLPNRTAASSTATAARTARPDLAVDRRGPYSVSLCDQIEPTSARAVRVGRVGSLPSSTGPPQAALALADGRVIANPCVPNAPLRAHLRLRATAYRSDRREPSVAERIRAALSGSASGRPLRAAVDVPPETPGRPRGNPGQHPHLSIASTPSIRRPAA